MPKTPKLLPRRRKRPYNLLKTRHILQINPHQQASTRARTSNQGTNNTNSPTPRAQTKPNRTTNKILSRRLGFYNLTSLKKFRPRNSLKNREHKPSQTEHNTPHTTKKIKIPQPKVEPSNKVGWLCLISSSNSHVDSSTPLPFHCSQTNFTILLRSFFSWWSRIRKASLHMTNSAAIQSLDNQ